MLDVHQHQVKSLYQLPQRSSIAYDRTSTQICVDGIPLFACLKRELNDVTYRERLLRIRERRKQRIVEAHANERGVSSEEMFHLQFDYELLGLDHLVDMQKVSDLCASFDDRHERGLAVQLLTTPATGQTFFGETQIRELEVGGRGSQKHSP